MSNDTLFPNIALQLSEWLDSQSYLKQDQRPTIVFAFDNYGDMERAWRSMLADFKSFMLTYETTRMKEVNNFTIAGLQFQFRLKLNKEIT